MRRGADVELRSTPPGIFETIATAMSALLIQPLPFVVPVLVDLYLWGGVRLSPAAVVNPFRHWLLAQNGVDATQLAGPLDTLERLGRVGDLSTILGWFLPSLFVDGGRNGNAEIWRRPSIDPGRVAVTIIVALLLVLAGVWVAMLFAVMLARVVRGYSLLDIRLLKASGVATVRYLGFLALLAIAIGIVLVPSAVVGVLFLLFSMEAIPVLVATLLVPLMIVAYVFLAFVGDAIVLVGVGPLRACSLSFGVVRRNVWASIGLLLVVVIASGAIARLAGYLAGDIPGVALAVAGYAFVATGLALARMQFFYDRLGRWRADLIVIPQPVSS